MSSDFADVCGSLDPRPLERQNRRSVTHAKDEARSAGRGLLSITGAKIYFIVAGYALQLALPRLLGSRATFGLYSSAMSLVSIVNNVIIAATVQSVSKAVSESADDEHAKIAIRQGLVL